MGFAWTGPVSKYHRLGRLYGAWGEYLFMTSWCRNIHECVYKIILKNSGGNPQRISERLK